MSLSTDRLRSIALAAGWITPVLHGSAIQDRELKSCRKAGMLAQLVIWVNAMASLTTWRGEFAAAASLAAEAEAIAAATGTRFPPTGAMALAAFRGDEAEAAPLIEAVITAAQAAGQGVIIQHGQWLSAILYNGLGRYDKALAGAQAAEQAHEMQVRMWALPELIEAASRTGQAGLAADALARLAEATSVGQTDWGQGIYARSRALLSEGEDTERWYLEAGDRLGRTRFRPELARAYLLHGEWLHGAADQALADLGHALQPMEGRLAGQDRQQLRAAMGAEAFEAEYAAGRTLDLARAAHQACKD